MSYEVKGKIHKIFDTEEFNSGFSKRGFVITTEEQYPQDIYLEFVKDKCSVLDKYSEGDFVTASFNLRGSEWNGKYYVNLNCWKLISAGDEY